jgi:hypothetical protein
VKPPIWLVPFVLVAVAAGIAVGAWLFNVAAGGG